MMGLMWRRLVAKFGHQKLSQDIAYSLGSFVILALVGIAINVVIVATRDTAALGVFNLAYAVYITASQLATVGLHYSVLRHAAFHVESPEQRSRLFFTAAICATGLGIVAAIAMYLAEPLFARLFSSEATAAAIRNAALGLALFPLNKVVLAYLNALRRMKAIAFLQSFRYLVIFLLVSMIAVSNLPVSHLTFCFCVAEAFMLALGLAYVRHRRLAPSPTFCVSWMGQHFRFGVRALPAGLFVEVNSRIDVLMIGFFLDDKSVGIYSFAAMLVDGMYHILAMVRINFNPLLVAAARDNDYGAVGALRQQSQKMVLPLMVVLAAGLIFTYWIAATWVLPGKDLMLGIYSLIILLAALVPVSFLIPFDNLMMVSGHPGLQTMQQVATVGVNATVMVVLLPIMGIEGAAIATAFSYIAGILMLLYLARRTLGWNLLAKRQRIA